MSEMLKHVGVFVEGDGATFIAEVDGFYMDIGIKADLTVSAYVREPDGTERFVEEGTPLERVDPEMLATFRAMITAAKGDGK